MSREHTEMVMGTNLKDLKPGDFYDAIPVEKPLDLTPSPDCNWLILQTEPGRDFTVTANLLMRRVPFYAPTFLRVGRVPKRAYEAGATSPYVHRPLFPGLLFIAENVVTPKWHEISSCFGVLSKVEPYVKFGDYPAFVRPDQMAIIHGIEIEEREKFLSFRRSVDEIARIEEAERDAAAAGKVIIRFNIGEQVRLAVHDVLKNCHGTIQDIDDKGRICLLMEIMRRQVLVHVTQDQVEAVLPEPTVRTQQQRKP